MAVDVAGRPAAGLGNRGFHEIAFDKRLQQCLGLHGPAAPEPFRF